MLTSTTVLTVQKILLKVSLLSLLSLVTWEMIREVIGQKKNRENLPDFFRHNGSILTETIDIAEGFNDFSLELVPNLLINFQTLNSTLLTIWVIQ